MSDTHTLNAAILKDAYRQGYFPMPHPETAEIYWFHPDPRTIIPLDGLHVSRSLARTLRKQIFNTTIDQAFADVMRGCADRPDSWINDEFLRAYQELHHEGLAHSLEVWQNGALVGGTYGVAIGGLFCAESMFHRATDASKVAIYHLVEHLKARGMLILEVQFLTPHLASLGAIEVRRAEYLKMLAAAVGSPHHF